MKINFIRHISDDILKENQDLKNTIISTRMALKKYQDDLLMFIQQSFPDFSVLDTPQQTLRVFIKTVEEQYRENETSRRKSQDFVLELRKSQKETEKLQQELKKRKGEEEFREKKWRQGRIASERIEAELKQDLEQTTKERDEKDKQLKSIHERYRIQTLLQEEIKRKELEQTRIHQHKKMMEMRDRLELQQVTEQKKAREYAHLMEKRVKELEKTIQKMIGNMQLEQSESKVLTRLILELQQSMKVGKSIQALKDDIFEYKKTIMSLEGKLLSHKSTIKEYTAREGNLQSQLQRQAIERKEFEKKYDKANKLMEQAESEKQKIQDHFISRWNNQFEKVKKNLEVKFRQKEQALEAKCAQMIADYQKRMAKCEADMYKFKNRNEQLQLKNKKDEEIKEGLSANLQQSKKYIEEIRRELKQNWQLSRQEIIVISDKYTTEIQKLSSIIKSKQDELIRKQNKYEAITNRYNKELQQQIEEAKDLMTIQWKQKLLNVQNQKAIQSQKHSVEVTDLTQQLKELKEKAKETQQNLIRICDQKVEIARQEQQQQVQNKDEEWINKYQGVLYKCKEMELKVLNTRKEFQDQKHTLTREMLKCERQSNQFLKVKDSLEREIVKIQKEKLQMVKEMEHNDKYTSNLAKIIKDKDQQIKKINKEASKTLIEAKNIQQKQLNWEQELSNLKEQMRADFQQLKVNFAQQEKILKSKIWYLEERLKHPIMTKKNYDKIKNLQGEKEQLKAIIDLKQSQNIALQQVKDYYEVRFRECEAKQGDEVHKTKNKLLLSRKMAHIRKQSCRVATNRTLEDSKDVKQMKKYITHYNKKQSFMSHSRTKYSEGPMFDRLKTNPI